MTNTFGINIIPQNDQERIEVLRSYKIIYSHRDESLNNLVQLIAEDFFAPIALITFVDEEQVFVKASVGMDGVEKVDRGISFCSLAVLSDEPIIIENASKDPCFIANPLVHGDFGLKFYAGAPLTTKEGFNIGAVCIVDKVERSFSDQEQKRLVRFAKSVMQEIELRCEVKRRNEQLEEKEIQLRQAFKLAKIGSWEYDVENNCTTWSDELYEIYGIEKTEVNQELNSLYISMIHPDHKAMAMANFYNPEQVPPSLTIKFIRPDKKIIYLTQISRAIYNAQGKLIKMTGISQDTTERMEYEEKLRLNEIRFKSLVQNSSDLIGVIDLKGNYTYVAESVKPMLGYEASFFNGRNAFEFIHPEDKDSVISCLSLVQNNRYIDVPPFRFLNSKGEWRWIESKVANLLQDPVINGLVVNSRDITKAVELEEELKKETELRQKSITSAVIKAQESERSQIGLELHDNVNQVLTTIKLYNEMISDGIGDQKTLIKKSSHHLQMCIDEIRSISKRLSAPTLGSISLEDSINELVESINLTKKVEIAYSAMNLEGLKISDDLHLAVYRIIQEQLNNIIKYAGATFILITLQQLNGALRLNISDDGKGFDINSKRKGIGITNMRTRAENLNGQFHLHSTPGNGCKLDILFPLQDMEEAMEFVV